MYSGDMADATVFIMEKVAFKDLIPAGSKEIRNTHINIGTGEEITIADLAVLLKETTGFRGNLEFDHSKTGWHAEEVHGLFKAAFAGVQACHFVERGGRENV